MIPLETLGRVTTPDGKELVLHHRDGIYHIRVDGMELMSNRAHGSEDALAELACAKLRRPPKDRPPGAHSAPRILIGGLGMGYTLRAALEQLPRHAIVEVVEVFAAVVEWNRGPLGPLARRPLEDPRVQVILSHFGDYLGDEGPSYDAILLDVDNGPEAFTLQSNAEIYTAAGLANLRRRLKDDGTLTVWSSAGPNPRFKNDLGRAGFEVRADVVAARHLTRGPKHTIYVAHPRMGGAKTRPARRAKAGKRQRR
jgi:spermidine synthase